MRTKYIHIIACSYKRNYFIPQKLRQCHQQTLSQLKTFLQVSAFIFFNIACRVFSASTIYGCMLDNVCKPRDVSSCQHALLNAIINHKSINSHLLTTRYTAHTVNSSFYNRFKYRTSIVILQKPLIKKGVTIQCKYICIVYNIPFTGYRTQLQSLVHNLPLKPN